MRQQPAFLEHDADPAPMRRNPDPLFRVDQYAIVERHPPRMGPQQAAHDVDQRRLAGSGPAEKRRDAVFCIEIGREVEGALPMRDRDRQPARHATSLRATPRARSSDATSAAMETATDTRVSFRAPASPPGTWVSV